MKYKFTIHNPLLSKPDAPRLVTPKIIPTQVLSTTKNRVKNKNPLPAPLQPALPIQPAPVILSQPNPLLAQAAPLQLATGQTTTPETQVLNTPTTPGTQPKQTTRPNRLPAPTPKRQ